MANYKKPFKVVQLKERRLKGLDELKAPLWSPLQTRPPISWSVFAIGLLIGVCLGLAYVLTAK